MKPWLLKLVNEFPTFVLVKLPLGMIINHPGILVHSLQYMSEVKQRAAFIYFSVGAFSQAEALFLESGCDPREVGCARCLSHECHMTVTYITT